MKKEARVQTSVQLVDVCLQGVEVSLALSHLRFSNQRGIIFTL
jgi:hypothetical protein